MNTKVDSLAIMPRPPRHTYAGECYHVLNRANRRAEVFHDSADYFAFMRLIERAQQRIEIPLFAYCLMPNHIHLVFRPRGNGDIARWMQWLFTTHARHYHEKYGTTGHVWQGRYKHFPVQGDHHLLTLLRYVERNAVRAKLVTRAEDWRWGSLYWRARDQPILGLAEIPTPLPSAWHEFVNQPQTAAELAAIRTSVNRQRPFGADDWVLQTATSNELHQTMTRVGRPRRSRSGTIC
jgi:putative transposase